MDFWYRLYLSPEWPLVLTSIIILIAFFAILMFVIKLLFKISKGDPNMKALLEGIKQGVETPSNGDETSEIISKVGRELGSQAKGLVTGVQNLAIVTAANQQAETNNQNIKDVHEMLQKEVGQFNDSTGTNGQLAHGSSYQPNDQVNISFSGMKIDAGTGALATPEVVETPEDQNRTENNDPVKFDPSKEPDLDKAGMQEQSAHKYDNEAFVRRHLPDYQCVHAYFNGNSDISLTGDWDFVGENQLPGHIFQSLYTTFNSKKSGTDEVAKKIFAFLEAMKKLRK